MMIIPPAKGTRKMEQHARTVARRLARRVIQITNRIAKQRAQRNRKPIKRTGRHWAGVERNKGARVYDEWRQGWLAREAARLGRVSLGGPPQDSICMTCGNVWDVIVQKEGRWVYLYGNLVVGHKRGRLSHPEDKMSDDGVGSQCHDCNGKAAGQRNVLPRKDGGFHGAA